MKRRVSVLFLLAFAAALVGCDDSSDDSAKYVAPYDVCALHHGDATACQAEPGCRMEDKILKGRFGGDGQILYLYGGDFCIPDLDPAPVWSNNANNAIEGSCTAATSLSDGTMELFFCPRCGECKPFFDIGWERVEGTNSELEGLVYMVPFVNEECYEMGTKEGCASAPVASGLNVASYTYGPVMCVWMDDGYTLGAYENGQCVEIAQLGPSCVSASKWGSQLIDPEASDFATNVPYVYHDHLHKNVMVVTTMDATEVIGTEPWTMVTKDSGTVHIWGLCPSDSTDPGCSCTFDATDSTGM